MSFPIHTGGEEGMGARRDRGNLGERGNAGFDRKGMGDQSGPNRAQG